MAETLYYYGVTKELVAATASRQLNVVGAVAPGFESVEPGGHCLDWAAADLMDALSRGGYGDHIECSSTNNAIAYFKLQRMLAERAALYWLREVLGVVAEENETYGKLWGRSRAEFEELSKGVMLGEVQPTTYTKRSVARIYLGEDDIDDLDARRYKSSYGV